MDRMTCSFSVFGTSLAEPGTATRLLVLALLIWVGPIAAQAEPAALGAEPPPTVRGADAEMDPAVSDPAAAVSETTSTISEMAPAVGRFSPATESETDLRSSLETGFDARRGERPRGSLAADFDRELTGVTANGAEGPGVGAAGRVVERFAPPVAAGSGPSAFAAGTDGQGSLGVSALRPCDTPGAACRNFGGPRAVTVPPNNPIIAGGRPTPGGAQ